MGYARGTKRKSRATPRSAKRTRFAPKALTTRRRRRNYRANYKLSKPFKSVLNKFLTSKQERHFTTIDIPRQWLFPHPLKDGPDPPIGIQCIMPHITQVGIPTIGGAVMSDNIEARSGANLRMRSLTVSLSLRLNPTYLGYTGDDPEDATGIRYKIYILSMKNETQYNDVVKEYFGNGLTGVQLNLLKNGNTTEPWDAKMEHWNYPINSQLFTTHAVRSGQLTKGELQAFSQVGVGHAPVPLRTFV